MLNCQFKKIVLFFNSMVVHHKLGFQSSHWGKGSVWDCIPEAFGVWNNFCCCHLQEMAVAVSQDLKVHMMEDTNARKLVNSQQTLKSAIQKGDPKCLGVSVLMHWDSAACIWKVHISCFSLTETILTFMTTSVWSWAAQRCSDWHSLPMAGSVI